MHVALCALSQRCKQLASGAGRRLSLRAAHLKKSIGATKYTMFMTKKDGPRHGNEQNPGWYSPEQTTQHQSYNKAHMKQRKVTITLNGETKLTSWKLMCPLLLWSMSSNRGRSRSVSSGCVRLYSLMYLSNCRWDDMKIINMREKDKPK